MTVQNMPVLMQSTGDFHQINDDGSGTGNLLREQCGDEWGKRQIQQYRNHAWDDENTRYQTADGGANPNREHAAEACGSLKAVHMKHSKNAVDQRKS